MTTTGSHQTRSQLADRIFTGYTILIMEEENSKRNKPEDDSVLTQIVNAENRSSISGVIQAGRDAVGNR